MSSVFGGLTPSKDSQETVVYRVQETQLGNGYKAVSPDGANGTMITWQINFDNIDGTMSAALEAWFKTVPCWITWLGDGVILPADLTFRITKDGWQKTALPGNINSYQFNVEQVF
jgi:hypothetical protein